MGRNSVSVPHPYGLMRKTSGAANVGFEGDFSTVKDALNSVLGQNNRHLQPAYIEQHFTGFYGRGMLTAEPNNAVSETDMSTTAAGADTFSVASATNLRSGGTCTIRHDNGLYSTYFMLDVTGTAVTIQPKLKYACTNGTAKVERTWYNRAHPGKFYMRELAQRIARSTERETCISHAGRLAYLDFTTDATYADENALEAIGAGSSVLYYDASNAGESTYDAVRFGPDRSAFVSGFTEVNAGMQTPLYKTNGAPLVTIRALIRNSHASTIALRVVSDSGFVIAQSEAIEATGVMQEYRFNASLRHYDSFRVQVVATVYAASGGYFTVGYLDVFETPATDGDIVLNKSATVVVVGDSWVAGDLATTAEREPITTQLALELPHATVINEGIGGNTVFDILARFDDDVAPHNPAYVVVNTGTNDAYNPSSETFDPNAVSNFLWAYDQLISKIINLGARPIILGVPALAEYDAEAPLLLNFALNDRAKRYVNAWLKYEGGQPFIGEGSNANGRYIKRADGTMTCFHTVTVTTTAADTQAVALWTFPQAFTAVPAFQASISNYGTEQMIAVGTYGATSTTVGVSGMTSVGAYAIEVDLVANGFWR